MSGGAKRLYIGNLPSDITDTDLKTKFSKFGTVEEVEIKLRKDDEGNTLNTFAFLNLNTSQGNIEKCISTFSNATWKGHPMKIQMAQESFLSRLKKERQENEMKNREDTESENTVNKDSESTIHRTFNTDKFSHKDKLQQLGQGNKCQQKTSDRLVGDKNSKDTKVSEGDYNPMEKLLNSRRNQKSKNTHHENEVIGRVKLQTDLKLKDSSKNVTNKTSEYDPFQLFLYSSNKKNEGNKSESSAMKTKPQISTSFKKARRASESLFLSDQESQLSPDIKNKKMKRIDAQKEHNYSDFDSEYSDEETPVSAKHIPVFQGTKSVLISESKKKIVKHSHSDSLNIDASGDDKTEVQRENAGSRSSSLGLKLEKEMMRRFEAFSNSWKDSETTDEAAVEKASKSFVTDLDTAQINRTPILQKQKGKKPKSVKTKQSDKPRVKTERHALSDHRRVKALQEKEQVMKGHKRIIREALSAVDSGCPKNKKIVFDSEDRGTPADNAPQSYVKTNDDDGHSHQEPSVKGKQHILFTEDEGSSEAFKVLQQFEGAKDEKLLKLQSSFSSDERFHLDERFYDSNEDIVEEHSHIGKQSKPEVLNSKTSLQMKEKIFKDTSQLRFDPTKEDHEKFILKCDKEESNEGKRKKNDKNTKKKEVPQPEVSSERYFEVSNDFSSLFKDTGNKSQGEDFSLLKFLGRLDKPEAGKKPEDSYKVTHFTPEKHPQAAKNPLSYDLSDCEQEGRVNTSEQEEEVKTSEQEEKVKTSEQEEEIRTCEEEEKVVHPTGKYFFFQNDDERLKEGIAFFTQQSKHMGSYAMKYMRQQKQLSLIKKKIKHMGKKLKTTKKQGLSKKKHFKARKPIKRH